MNKAAVLSRFTQQLEADISVSKNAVEIARDTATHKDCLGSSKYETMGTEASYLAKGQGERLLELKRALTYFKKIIFTDNNKVCVPTLLTLEDEQGKQQTLFLAADAGGLKVKHADTTITVITPQSPLGRALLGKQEGDVAMLNVAEKETYYEVISLHT